MSVSGDEGGKKRSSSKKKKKKKIKDGDNDKLNEMKR